MMADKKIRKRRRTSSLAEMETDKEYRKYIKEQYEGSVKTDARALIMVTLGSLLSAFNVVNFVNAARLVPGGISGVSVLTQRLADQYLGVAVPFSLLSIGLNIVPVCMALVVLGRKYTLFSTFSVVVYSIAVDLVPHIFISENSLLLAVFGGILAGIAGAVILNAGASQGGTDFIAMVITSTKGINAFNYIMLFNFCLVGISAIFFGIETALYTIIYYYAATQICNALYIRYEKKTLFIVTNKPQEVADEIRKVSNHTCTILRGEGGFTGQDINMVYTIIGSEEMNLVKKHVLEKDEKAFINVIESTNVEGNFFVRPYHWT